MSKINVNGNIYSGNSIVINNGRVIVDGNEITPENVKEINISVDGDVVELKVDSCSLLKVSGNVTHVQTKSGDVSVLGDVEGNIQTMSGDVKCGSVGGSITTMSGNINL